MWFPADLILYASAEVKELVNTLYIPSVGADNDSSPNVNGDGEVTALSSKTNLYLDVDGVLLGHQDAARPEVSLAKHAEAFLDFGLRHFDCYWLTTHCDGTAESVLRCLRPHCTEDLLRKLVNVRPTQFRSLKTEALEGDFHWVEDAPLQAEIEWLRTRGVLSRWVEVNTRKRPDDLLAAMARLRASALRRRGLRKSPGTPH